jgi:hypothetical protein
LTPPTCWKGGFETPTIASGPYLFTTQVVRRRPRRCTTPKGAILGCRRGSCFAGTKRGELLMTYTSLA